jgi:hypothetical protein
MLFAFMQSSGRFETDAAVLGDHGAQPFARLGQVDVTDVNRREKSTSEPGLSSRR